MDVQQLKKQYKDLLKELFLEEFLDDYFRQVREVEQDRQGFAFGLATEYFKETDRKIDMMSKLLCIRNLEQFKDDMDLLRNKLACVFQLEHLIAAAGGSL
ncbi:putative histidine-containing phosphotransfer protein 1 [Cocos nucifera]|uniref:Putative histidine-containing phosphotransfer protein 1 n=1 Tax=Cocos nucifera TaxID=13894 RepID=A0A8K0HTG0_COCNU|nr:putative histidine-containing phosphotransfer protein 1 [Cocos nucifera]